MHFFLHKVFSGIFQVIISNGMVLPNLMFCSMWAPRDVQHAKCPKSANKAVFWGQKFMYTEQMDAAVLRDRLPEVTQKPSLGPKSLSLQRRH